MDANAIMKAAVIHLLMQEHYMTHEAAREYYMRHIDGTWDIGEIERWLTRIISGDVVLSLSYDEIYGPCLREA